MKLTEESVFNAKLLINCELLCLAKNPYERSKLPNPQDFAKALYTFDIGQNDLSVGFRKLSFDQLRAQIPDIVNQLATAVRVSITLSLNYVNPNCLR